VGPPGLGHFQRPRNFIFENKFSREGCLANCHRQFSPETLRVREVEHIVNSPNKKLPFGSTLFGGSTGARTRDTRLKRPLLYQLSYGPTLIASHAVTGKLTPYIIQIYREKSINPTLRVRKIRSNL